MIEIKQFQYYFRWYPFELNASAVLWWYCRDDGQIVSSADLDPKTISTMNEGLTPKEQVLIPIAKVNMVEMEQDFLKEFRLQRLVGQFLSSAENDFDCLFKKYVDDHNLMQAWHQFESNRLQDAAITWCHQYGVRFTLD